MGFNVGIHSKQLKNNLDCYNFIGRSFYNFVNSYEMFGEESIVVRCGEFYGLDLKPLTKLVYTWDEPTGHDINSNTQKTEILLNLVDSFKSQIKKDNLVCEKIEYAAYENPLDFDDVFINELKKQHREAYVKDILDIKDSQLKPIIEHPNLWNDYFKNEDIINDLDNLRKSLRCLLQKGIDEMFLTAG